MWHLLNHLTGHETSFMDVPRVSTIQAMLLLLKARESLPKKGYYYRSWQTVKTIVSMAKDLDIHEHYSNHAEGRPCDLSPIECLIHTRIWQALLVVEVMIGAPQGKIYALSSIFPWLFFLSPADGRKAHCWQHRFEGPYLSSGLSSFHREIS